jgi:hypothetical protein
LPSIIPSYVYTLFACMAVGALLIYAASVSNIGVTNEADLQELKKIAEFVAVKGYTLVSMTLMNNLTANIVLNVPFAVGNQIYWLRLDNDSSRSWVGIGFGTVPQISGQRTYVPAKVFANGTFVSGTGMLVLKCHLEGSATFLQVSGGS